MLVNLIRTGETSPIAFIDFLNNEDQIYGVINHHYKKYKNYLYTEYVIKKGIIDGKIKCLKKYRKIINNIVSEKVQSNETLYLHCLLDCGLHKKSIEFIESIKDRPLKDYLYCFYYLQTKNSDELIRILSNNIDNSYIIDAYLPSIASELCLNNSFEYVKLLHLLKSKKNSLSKENSEILDNILSIYFKDKKVSLVIACMNREENLIKILPSWINIPYIDEIIVVDYSSKNPLLENYAIKQLHEENLIKVIRVDGEHIFNLGKAYNLGFDFCKNDYILKIDADYLSLDYGWLDLLLKSNRKNFFVHGSYHYSYELSGFFITHKSNLVYFREDLNGYGYDEIDLYNRASINNQNLEKIIWFDIENSIKHIYHDNNSRATNYTHRNIKDSERNNRYICERYSPVVATRNSYTINNNTITYNKIPIEKIFCINLDQRTDRWESLSHIENIERFSAIKINDESCFLDYGLKLNPVDISSKLYFQLSSGAIGCFLSHYLLWKKIVKEKISYSLILEDDVDKDSVTDLLRSNLIIENHDLINLSKRFRKVNDRYFFDGGESYILSYNGAEKLLNIIENSILLKNVVPEKFNSINELLKKNEIVDIVNWHNSSITCAIDKLLGYCCENCVDKDYRLNSYIYPTVDLNQITHRLSNINSKNINAWELTPEQVLKLI